MGLQISENKLKGLIIFIVLALITFLWWLLSGRPILSTCLLGLLTMVICYVNFEGTTYLHGTNEVRYEHCSSDSDLGCCSILA